MENETKLIDRIEREHIAKPEKPVENFMGAMERIKEKDWEWEVKQVCWRYMHALMPCPVGDHKLIVDKLEHLRDWWIRALRALSIGAAFELMYILDLSAEEMQAYKERLAAMQAQDNSVDDDDENVDDAVDDPAFDDWDTFGDDDD